MTSRSFGSRRPNKPHLLRSRGMGGEVLDVRLDVDAAFSSLEEELSVFIPTGYVTIVPSEDPTGMLDRVALASALNSGSKILLQPGGVYYLDARIVVTSAVPGTLWCTDMANPAIICRGSAFVASGGGAADDPENCLLLYRSSLAVADETTFASGAGSRRRRGRGATAASALALAATLASPIGKTYRLRSIGLSSGGVGGLDTDVTIDELVTIASGAGPYVLDGALRATHGENTDASNTTQVREVTTVVRNVEIRGVQFRSSTTANGAATQIACAVYIENVIATNIEIEAFGFSRTAVELHGCRDHRVTVWGKGNNNGLVWERSSHDGTVDVYNDNGGARFHANGIPRAMLYVDYMCFGGTYRGDVSNVVCGFEIVGAVQAKMPYFRVFDCDTTQRVSTDATRLLNIGGSDLCGAGLVRDIQTGTTFDETPYGLWFGTLIFEQVYGPTSDGQQVHFAAVNTQGMRIDSLTCLNKGGDVSQFSPLLTAGVLLDDCYDFSIGTLWTAGVEGALELYGSWVRGVIDVWHWDPTHAHTTTTQAIRWGMTADPAPGTPIALRIGRMICPDTPTFLVGNIAGVTSSDLSRACLLIEQLDIHNRTDRGATWEGMRWFIAANGYTPATGELAEIIPPQVVTFDNTTDVWACVGHGFANGTPVYVRAQPNDGAAVIPTGYTATTVYWVINRAADTFQLSLTKGGAAYTGGTTNGTADIEILPAMPAIRQPTAGPAASRRHVAVVNGTGFGSGPLVTGYYICAMQGLMMVRTDDVAHAGDLLEVSASTGVANNNLASADPFAIVLGNKTAAAVGTVQCRRLG